MLDSIHEIDHPILAELANDPRKGVQQLLLRKRQILLQEQVAFQAYLDRLSFERRLLQAHPNYIIAGIDEAGRGPIAGPVVAAAVVLPEDTRHWVAVNDSKCLNQKQREELAELIRQESRAYAIASLSPAEIDHFNIYQASRLAMTQAVEKLSPQPNYLLIDAMTIDLTLPQEALIKGDQRSLSIAAASILAKVFRDQVMMDYDQQFPEFGWAVNKGYPTRDHLNALNKYGYTDLHRQSFGPVQNCKKRYVN